MAETMIKFTKIKPGDPLNDYQTMKTAMFECYHCHSTTVVPVHNIEQAEANYWRLRYEMLLGSLNGALEDCRMLHGDDPIRIFIEKRLKKIREQLG